MGFLLSGLFWGVIVVLIGLSIIINATTGLKIPLFRIILGLLVLYLGCTILFGATFRGKGKRTTAFDSRQVKVTELDREYNVLFGRSVVDLTGTELKPGPNRVEVNTVFGAGVIRLDSKTPARVKVSAAFAGARLPDGSSISFGEHTWRSANWNEDSTRLEVEASAVFSGLEVEVR